MQESKWGNSLAIRINSKVAEALHLKEGDEINIKISGEREFQIERDRSRFDALSRLQALSGNLPEGWRFDREDANKRG